LDGIEQTAKETILLIARITETMQEFKQKIQTELPRIYSHDLLNNLFSHPYTKIDFVTKELNVTRITATKYLKELVGIGLLVEHKSGKHNYYVNTALYDLLSNVHQGNT
jgi:Fic family protein